MSQIEIVMYVALGFGVAALVAMLLGRLSWSYAVKLGRKRIERAQPAALAEVKADRDRLRAEYAMLSRKLEIRFEELKTRLTEQTAEVSRNRNRIEQLAGEIRERDTIIRERETEIAQLKDQIGPLEHELATRTQSLQQLKEQLRDRELEQAGIERELAAARVSIGEREQIIASQRDKLQSAAAAAAAAVPGAGEGAPFQERFRLRIEQLSGLSRQIEEQRTQLTREHDQLKALKDDIARSQKRRKQQKRHVNGEAGPVPVEAPVLPFDARSQESNDKIETLDTESRRLEDKIAEAERETAALQEELKDLDTVWTAKLAELSLAATPEQVPIEVPAAEPPMIAATAEETAPAMEGPEPPMTGEAAMAAETESEPAGKSEEGFPNVITLANRIRALQRDIGR